MTALAKRSVMNFFRDKLQVFFSMMGVLMIIALFLLFLGDLMMGALDPRIKLADRGGSSR